VALLPEKPPTPELLAATLIVPLLPWAPVAPEPLALAAVSAVWLPAPTAASWLPPAAVAPPELNADESLKNDPGPSTHDATTTHKVKAGRERPRNAKPAPRLHELTSITTSQE
jgi:hypothetical protein